MLTMVTASAAKHVDQIVRAVQQNSRQHEEIERT